MIKMEINKAVTAIKASGTLPDITSEILLGIKVLKDKFDVNDMGDDFIDALKGGLDFIKVIDSEEGDSMLENKIDELVDKALENDDFLDEIMDKLPDDLKADFTKRLKKRAGEKK